MNSGQRRCSKRVVYYSEAAVEGLDVGRAEMRVSDLSMSGAFIDSRTVLPAGTMSKLTFRVRDREIQVTIVVRYAIPEIGMGVHFLNLGPEDCALIEDVVKAQG